MTNKTHYKKIVQNYNFTQEDIENLEKASTFFSQYSQEFLKGFYQFIFNFEYAKKFINSDAVYDKHKDEIGKWYLNLFCGKYDDSYFHKLGIISEVHVKIGLPHHYVNAAFSYVRRFLKDVLIKENKFDFLSSVDKIIDINLDFLTVTYSKNEQAKLLEDIVFIRNCVSNDGVVPFFQPIFDAKTLHISKYESLMRLYKKEINQYASIFPYLQTAKDIKIYEKLTQIMIQKVFLQMESNAYEFSVNLDYEDLSNPKITKLLTDLMQTFPKTNRVIFEIVESEFIDDFSIVENFATQMRDYGVKIAIDDFGSGFSSMENILKLKPEIIKIDGTLIKNLDTNNDSKIFVRNIISMAKELNASCVAEYVHNKEICKICQELQIDYLQGFYLGEPSLL